MTDQSQTLSAQQARAIYRQAPLPMAASLAAGLLLGYLLWDAASHIRIFWAVTAIASASIAGLCLALAFARVNPPEGGVRLWGQLFTGALLLQGLAWGVGAVAMSPEDSALSQVIILFWIAGLAGAAAGLYSVHGRFVMAFVIPALSPAAVYTFWLGGRLHLLLGISLLAYMTALLWSIHKANIFVDGFHKLTVALESEIRQRSRSQHRYKSLFESAVEGLALHRHGAIVEVNPSFLEIFGYRQGEEAQVIGRPAVELIAPGARQAAATWLSQAGQRPGRAGERQEFEAVKKDGSSIHIEVVSKPHPQIQDGASLISIRDITESSLSQQKAQAARLELEQMIDNLQDVFFRTNIDGEIIRVSPSVERIYGLSRRQMERQWAASLFADQEQMDLFAAELKRSGGVARNFEAKARRKDGEQIWISINAHYYHGGGELLGIEGTAREITEWKKMEEALRHANAETGLANRRLEKTKIELEEMIDNMQDVFFRTDINGTIIRTSPSVADVFGYDMEQMENQTIESLFARPEDLERFNKALMEWGGVVRNFEAQIRRKEGRMVWTSTNAHHYYNEADELAGVEGTIRDVTERKKMEDALREISQKDGLTGLFNRRHFDETLAEEWSRASRANPPSPLSLILIDIDYFKPFNDTYGHQEGDACLKKVSAAIKKVVHRTADMVARYGGEELVVVLPNTQSQSALHVAEQMRKAVAQMRIPHSGSKAAEHVTISSGVATMAPSAQWAPKSIIEKADKALYQAKETGRNRVVMSEE